jgi:hypothetical protein
LDDRRPEPIAGRKRRHRPSRNDVTIVLENDRQIIAKLVERHDDGATLSVPVGAQIPLKFQLQLPDGDCRRAEVIWQGVNRLGVRFA